jgi:hypothetical protein
MSKRREGRRTRTRKKREEKDLLLALPNQTYEQRKGRKLETKEEKRNTLTLCMCVEKYQRQNREHVTT